MMDPRNTLYIGVGGAQVAIDIDRRGNIELRQNGVSGSQVIRVEAADADEFRKAVAP